MTYTLFSKNNCPHCITAKQMLESAGELYEEIKIDGDPSIEPSISLGDFKALHHQVRSVPFITLHGKSLGGLLELKKHFFEN